MDYLQKLESLFTSTTRFNSESFLLPTTMAISAEPTALLSHLHRADGSATFSQNGYTIIGAVNGPLEVQRRDELPEAAAIDVIIRPAAGVGG